MPESKAIPYPRNVFRNSLYQCAAITFCVLFAIAMIANTQMGGEALWFFYARSLHSGLRLYADLHLALQPLFVLENDVWMQLFGTKTLVTEIPSVLHALALAIGIFLILRESDWPDWQKAIILASAFLICVYVSAYRFDDFHVTSDTFILYSLAALLWFARAATTQHRLQLAALLGVLSGLTITTRLNDGVALLAATLLSLLFLAKQKKILVAALCLLTALLTVVIIVKITGDSLSDYASNSIIGAAASKGVGRTSILARPWMLFTNSLHLVWDRGKRVLLWLFAIAAAGALIVRYRPKTVRYIFALQLCIVVAGFAFAPRSSIQELAITLVSRLTVLTNATTYLVALVVAARFFTSTDSFGKRHWDAREILIFVPLAELASASASTGGTTENNFLYTQMAMTLLLIPVIQPFRKYAAWANPSVVTVMAMLAFSCFTTKIHNPYSWNFFSSSPMFENRQWYRHPVYGPMYIDRDLLHFLEPVCAEINQSNSQPQLLSLPYSYPNYFCGTPPWHGYIQTYFDTSSPAAIKLLMTELNTAPPQWIVYQRQLAIMTGAERYYNNGQPIPHRYLDTLIMQKIATGQWQLVDKVKYLEGDGWLIIKTRP